MKSNVILWIIISILALFIFWKSCEKQPEIPQQPTNTISYEYANILEEEYKRTRGDTINKYLGITDTREFWFSLDSLKKYIEYVEYKGNELGYQNMGIRVYNGAYPSNSSHEAGFSTVFFIPTGENNSSKASFLFNFQPNGDNIEDIEGFNYGHGGKPPKEIE